MTIHGTKTDTDPPTPTAGYTLAEVLDWPEPLTWGTSGFITESPDGDFYFWRGRKQFTEDLDRDLFDDAAAVPVTDGGRTVARLVPATPLGAEVLKLYIKHGIRTRGGTS